MVRSGPIPFWPEPQDHGCASWAHFPFLDGCVLAWSEGNVTYADKDNTLGEGGDMQWKKWRRSEWLYGADPHANLGHLPHTII